MYKKQKLFLTQAIDGVDRESEIVGLTKDKYLTRKGLEEKLEKLERSKRLIGCRDRRRKNC